MYTLFDLGRNRNRNRKSWEVCTLFDWEVSVVDFRPNDNPLPRQRGQEAGPRYGCAAVARTRNSPVVAA